MSLATAAGAGLSGVEKAGAATVQITNFGNYVSAMGSTFFENDLSGDGSDDVGWGVFFGQTNPAPNYFSYFAGLGDGRRRTLPVEANLAGVVNASTSGSADPFFAKVGGISPYTNATTGFAKGHISIQFTDARINGQVPTSALVEIIASSDRTTPGTGTADGTRVTITRLIFDDSDPTGASLPSTSAGVQNSYTEFDPVPEPSSLALLIMGAAGVLARRQRGKVSFL
jgi:hypothetical protein